METTYVYLADRVSATKLFVGVKFCTQCFFLMLSRECKVRENWLGKNRNIKIKGL